MFVQAFWEQENNEKRKTSRWALETHSDLAGNRAHQKSISCGIHFLNGSCLLLYGSSRTVFSECNPPSALQIAAQQGSWFPDGVGKVDTFSGKNLVEDSGEVLVQVPRAFNVGDIGTKPFSCVDGEPR